MRHGICFTLCGDHRILDASSIGPNPSFLAARDSPLSVGSWQNLHSGAIPMVIAPEEQQLVRISIAMCWNRELVHPNNADVENTQSRSFESSHFVCPMPFSSKYAVIFFFASPTAQAVIKI
ncbi:MAG: hypothetical protein ACLTE2_05850 [Eubacteriales bacterium]